MLDRLAARLALPMLLMALAGGTAAAQSLGTYRWQTQPFCNVVTVTVTQVGGTYRLEGTDDQCGAATQGSVLGTAFPNPNGSVGLGFSIVATPGGNPLHVDATIDLVSLGGTWRDSAGRTGNFVFTPGASNGGAPRPTPGGLGAGAVDTAQVQQRVASACPAGQAVRAVHQDGSVTCEAVGGGGGITGVTAGTGLTGGGTSGSVVLGIAPGGVGSTQIADGSVGLADINQAQVQRRLSGACADGLFAIAVDVNGAFVCSDGGSTGPGNTGLGVWSLSALTTGTHNTAVGLSALTFDTTGMRNTAVGALAMANNATGDLNTAVGTDALLSNTIGHSNAAVGERALRGVTGGHSNVGVGKDALYSNTAGSLNVAVGRASLYGVTGSGNTAIGEFAGFNLSVGDNNLYLSNDGLAFEDHTIRVGRVVAGAGRAAHQRAFIAGIRGVTTSSADAIPVLIDSSGQLGTVSSSRRVKQDITDMGARTRGLFDLRPVTFRYISHAEAGSTTLEYGLIAEEVAEVYPDLVVRNQAGDIETVQYHKLAPMLLNEVQRLERERAALEQRVALQARELDELKDRVNRLVSASRR